MNKTTYKIKNMFKSEAEREAEAKMKFNQTKRSFTRYYNELNTSISSFSKMARDAELSGNHENALACTNFIRKLQKTQVKVQGLLQRFEMMHSMQRLTGVMSKFMQTCAEMGFSMDDSINLKSIMKDTITMDKALSKLDAMSDQLDMVFDTIDSGMGSTNMDGDFQEESEAETEKLLNDIMGRYNEINYTSPVAGQAAGKEQGASVAEDDTEERLRRMMQELKE